MILRKYEFSRVFDKEKLGVFEREIEKVSSLKYCLIETILANG
jgi:hypothetical protein